MAVGADDPATTQVIEAVLTDENVDKALLVEVITYASALDQLKAAGEPLLYAWPAPLRAKLSVRLEQVSGEDEAQRRSSADHEVFLLVPQVRRHAENVYSVYLDGERFGGTAKFASGGTDFCVVRAGDARLSVFSLNAIQTGE